MASPIDQFIEGFKRAAGEGAAVELKLRLLASREPALRPFVDDRLEEVEDEIARFFVGHLSEKERELLRLCRQLRNKLLHCDFSKARAKLSEMGQPIGRGNVRMISLSSEADESILKRITDAASGEPGSFRYVADTTSTADAGIFGWLLEMATSGDLAGAEHLFRETCAIVDRLAEVDLAHTMPSHSPRS